MFNVVHSLWYIVTTRDIVAASPMTTYVPVIAIILTDVCKLNGNSQK